MAQKNKDDESGAPYIFDIFNPKNFKYYKKITKRDYNAPDNAITLQDLSVLDVVGDILEKRIKLRIIKINPGVPSINPNNNVKQNGGGKNAQHTNQKAIEAAKKKLDEAKKQLDELKPKPNKTKEDNQLLEKLKKQIKHLQTKVNETGENHSQKAKGGN
jgi:hypothetical protein